MILMKNQKNLIALTSNFLFLLAAAGLGAALWLLGIPKEAGNAFLFGYSLNRLLELAAILVIALPVGLLSVLLKKRLDLQEYFQDENRRRRLARIGMMGGFLSAAILWNLTFIGFFNGLAEKSSAYVIRLLPFATYSFLVSAGVLFFCSFLPAGMKKTSVKKDTSLFTKPAYIILAILLIGWVLIEATGAGKAPEIISIVSLGVPLLEGQIWYVCGLLVLVMGFAAGWARLPAEVRGKYKGNVDVLICAVLWVLAAVLWMNLPLPQRNYFAPQALPPNYAKYPFSDAEQYDINSIWVWKGAIQGLVVSKPLYVVFLSILHALVGYEYSQMILIQTLVLALLPAVLYLIGKELHSRLGGLGMGVFAILREINSIQAVDVANVSNSKLLLSDLPATLLVCVLILVIIRWFKAGEGKLGMPPFIIGGLIACLNLMRIQTLLLEPLALLLVVMRYWKSWKKLIMAGLIMLLGLGLVLMPVLSRNRSITGVYWVDNPANSQALYRFFLDASEYEVAVPEAETQGEMLERNIVVISQVIGQNVSHVAGFVLDNFTRNILSTMLVLPIRLGNSINFAEYFQIGDPFWMEVYSEPNGLNALAVVINLMVLAIGIAGVYRKNKRVLWVLIGFYVIYNLSSALVRLSGWRYIMPVDWLSYAFFTFGIVEVMFWAAAVLAGWGVMEEGNWLLAYKEDAQPMNLAWKLLLIFGLVYFLAGAYIPLREKLVAANYPASTRAEVCETVREVLVGSEWRGQREELYQFCQREDVLAYKAIGVYPRYFEAGNGYYQRSNDPYFGEQDYARLVFRTVGFSNAKVYIKTEQAEIDFPDGAEVYVVGENKAKFAARMVLIHGRQPQLIVASEK